MAELPNRLIELREKILTGVLTQADVDRASKLIALDTAIYGRDVLEESIERTIKADEELGVPRP